MIYGLSKIHNENPLPAGDVLWERRNPFVAAKSTWQFPKLRLYKPLADFES
jgi:hypothetical protein